MQPGEFAIVEFTAKNLKKIPKTQLHFALASSHACNQLNYWRLYIIFDRINDGIEETEKIFVSNRYFYNILIAASGIYEYRKLCCDFLENYKKNFPEDGKKLESKFQHIKEKIESNKYAWFIRNKLAFHFDSKVASDGIDSLDKNTMLRFAFGKRMGEFVFDFSSELIVEILAKKYFSGDKNAFYKDIMSFTNFCNSEIIEFNAIFLRDLFARYGLMNNVKTTNPPNGCFGHPTTHRIPVFLTPNYKERETD
jgi:hypothetical protein